MPLITVRLGSRSSAVHVGRPLADLGPLCAQAAPGRRAVLVTDAAVGRLYAAAARRSLEAAGRTVRVVAVPPGESSKTLERAKALLGEFSRFGLERRDAVVALGGGVVSDLAGFAASVYLRGVAFAAAPTTLLAQVDASVGGKNGVNLPWGKNLVGTFHQPSFVLVDLAVLDSLPEREMRQGYAEIVKCGVIRSPRIFSVFENPPAGGARAELPFLVEECVRIKAAVVSRDERETRGLREILNFGHTIGHAVEISGAPRFSHGEAIAVGMAAEAELARRLGLCSGRTAARIRAAVAAAGLPGDPRAADRRAVVRALRYDKKVRDGRLRFVLPRAIGRTARGVTVAAEAVADLWRGWPDGEG